MNEPSRCHRGVSLLDVLWVMTILIILWIILMTVFQDPPRGPNGNATNMSNIRQTTVAFNAQALDDPRSLTADRVLGSGRADQIVRNRFTRLVTQDYLHPKVMINPAGTDTPWDGDAHDLWPRGSVTLGSDNLSYALIDHRSIAWRELAQGPGDRHQRPSPRIEPIIADKQVGAGSYWNADTWEGHVGWADGRVSKRAGPRTTVQFRNDRRREDHDIFTEAGDGTHNRLVNP